MSQLRLLVFATLLAITVAAGDYSKPSPGGGVCLQKEQCPDNEHCAVSADRYKVDPNEYPTFGMKRYNFMRLFYPVLRFLADGYFALVNAVFNLYNAFLPVEHVGWKGASKLLFISAREAAKRIREGKLKSKDLVGAYVARLKEVNPLVNGVAQDQYEKALKEAGEADAKLAKLSKEAREKLAKSQPLFGVPFTSKDNLMTKGLVTISGTWHLRDGAPAQRDAIPVALMRRAGAILLTTTTMPNGGLSWAGDSSSYGVVNNPHDSRRMTGGSSSGEGALIGAGASLCGIGNDIAGSIRIPAYHNGVFGLKPTNYPFHTISWDGIVPDYVSYEPAKMQLSNGPLCRYADDLPLAMAAMTNSSVEKYDVKVDFGKKLRLFYMEDLDILLSERLQPEQRDQVLKVKKYFENKFNLTVQQVKFPLMNRFFEMWGVTGWTAGLKSPSTLLGEFFDIYRDNPHSNSTWFEWEYYVVKNFVAPRDEKEAAFVDAKKDKLRRQLNELLGDDGVLLTATWPVPPQYHHSEPFTVFNDKFTQLFNMIGTPALVVPTGKSPVTNMPLGVQITAKSFNEALLIAVARELEKAFGGWVAPGQVPKELLEEQKKRDN